MHGSRGCLGCFSKPAVISVGEQPRRIRVRKRTGSKTSIPDDLWSTSTGEMDSHPTECSSTTNHPAEFVNHGFALWCQTRQQWHGSKTADNKPQVREPTISWNASYESLLGNNKPFARPIPLAEMVDFLVDLWEQDGLYD